MTVFSQDDITRRVMNLLVKAERTEFDDEARALTAKAAELAQTHAITEAMIDAFRPAGERAKPDVVRFRFSGNKSFMTQRVTLLSVVAEANDCKVVYKVGDPTAELFGFEDDIRFVQALYLSLLTQMTRQGDRALASYEAGQPLRGKRYGWKRQFYVGFTLGVNDQLQRVWRRVVAEADRQNPGRAELVLVGRRTQVEDLVSATYERLRRSGGRSDITDWDAYDRGAVAGRQANVDGGRAPRGASGYVGREHKEVTGR